MSSQGKQSAAGTGAGHALPMESLREAILSMKTKIVSRMWVVRYTALPRTTRGGTCSQTSQAKKAGMISVSLLSLSWKYGSSNMLNDLYVIIPVFCIYL